MRAHDRRVSERRSATADAVGGVPEQERAWHCTRSALPRRAPRGRCRRRQRAREHRLRPQSCAQLVGWWLASACVRAMHSDVLWQRRAIELLDHVAARQLVLLHLVLERLGECGVERVGESPLRERASEQSVRERRAAWRRTKAAADKPAGGSG